MAISTAMCTSFKQEILVGTHNFTATTGNTFKLALFTSSASLGASTTAFATTNEVSGTGYTAKGEALTRVNPSVSGTTAITDFTDLVFSTVTISSVRGAVLFNDDASNDASVCVLDFGADKAASSGDFTIVFPTADASNAIIRIA